MRASSAWGAELTSMDPQTHQSHWIGRSRGTGCSESDRHYHRLQHGTHVPDCACTLTEQQVEQLADVLVGLESVVHVGLELGIDVAEVELAGG
jgi:hypothetical protein